MTVIENSTILGLTANSQLVKEFPFLANARKALNSGTVSGGCRSCSHNRSGGQGVDFNQIKMTLASMSLEAQLKFKKITGWDKVKVIYASGSGMNTVIF